MKSKPLGKTTSQVEIQNVSQHGLWMLIKEREYFLPYEKFPWFREAKVSEIYNVVLLHEKYLYWSDLDVDLELESIIDPDQYPLVAKTRK